MPRTRPGRRPRGPPRDNPLDFYPSSMEESDNQAGQTWHIALKFHKELIKELEKLPKGDGEPIDMNQFEVIDDLLAKFRLGCVQTIFRDLDYAIAEKSESVLWTAHTTINHHYRRILGRLRSPNQTVEKRKIEQQYNKFLHISIKFYKGFIQRLTARYDIPELKRVAKGIKVELIVPAGINDMISPVPSRTSTVVLHSCHSTLIHLGDLSRYRGQATHKKSVQMGALIFYSLAHDLMPTSGFAFHQMGIVQLEEGRHIEIVYAFYRAWAVENPHPNAEQNLRAEFKPLRLPDSTSSNDPSVGRYHAFTMWFVKLHAFFYEGDVFPQHSELETEVMHRLRMASKSHDSGEVLLKMVLINIAAYHVACKKYTESQSENASRFCQYTLRLNIRFIMALSETIEGELAEIVRSDSSHSTDEEKTNVIIENLLPLLRTYIMWLSGRRHEIFGAAIAFGPLVPNMTKYLAKIFNLLCSDTYTQHLAPLPYMLFEDLETRGLLPLRDGIPRECRLWADQEGISKPRLLRKENRLAPLQESLARMLDVLRCAYFLAGDNSVPLALDVSSNGLVFAYQEFVPNGDLETPKPTDMLSKPPAVEPAAASQPSPAPQARTQVPAVSTNLPAGIPTGIPASLRQQESFSTTQAMSGSPSGLTFADYNMERGTDPAKEAVLDILAPLVGMTDKRSSPYGSRDETSYGMHSSTADEIFAQISNEKGFTKPVQPTKYQSLPWSWMIDSPENDTALQATRELFNNPTSPNSSTGKRTWYAEEAAAAAVAAQGSSRPVEERAPEPRLTLPNHQQDMDRNPYRDYQPPLDQRPLVDHTPRPASNNMMMPSPSFDFASSADDAHRSHLLQSFQQPSRPTQSPPRRTSAFSSWGQASSRRPKETIPTTPYGYYPENYPISSGASAFSHPSSLYQGTPANPGSSSNSGAGFRMPPPGRAAREGFTPSRENGPGANIRLQADTTTSSYDQAILMQAFATE